MGPERIQKILARAGVSSRRAAEELILAGRVEVNGRVVRELGTRADAGRDQIRVDGRSIGDAEDLRYYLLYKPERVVTTLSDPEGRKAVGDFLRGVDERVYPVGRLDYDAEGALLLTNDGDLAHRLTHPRWGVQRTYLAKVRGEPDDDAIARLISGVRLEDGKARAIEATFEQRTPKNTWIRIVVSEGRNHLVKRMCEAIGHPVVRLFRSDHAGLGVSGMKPGELRALSSDEVRALRKAVEKEAPPPPGGLPKRRRAAVRDPVMGTARRFEGRGPPRADFTPGEDGRRTSAERPSRAPWRDARAGDRAGRGEGRPGSGERPSRAPWRDARAGDRAGRGEGRPGSGERPSRAPWRDARAGDRAGRGERRPGSGERPARAPWRVARGEGRTGSGREGRPTGSAPRRTEGRGAFGEGSSRPGAARQRPSPRGAARSSKPSSPRPGGSRPPDRGGRGGGPRKRR
jgi:23S rRNA pseudouridine2605 synthase